MEHVIPKKKQLLIEKGKELFWKHGLRKITVEEICIKANVSKMTFYRFFANKTELAKEIIDIVIQESTEKFKNIMNDNNSVDEKMCQLILMKQEGTKEISAEFLADLYTNRESELKDYMSQKTKEIWNSLLNDYKKAQNDGWLRNDFKPEFLLTIGFKMAELLTDKQLCALYETPQELIMEITKMITYGIAPREIK